MEFNNNQEQQYFDQSAMSIPTDMTFPYQHQPMMYPWPMLYGNAPYGLPAPTTFTPNYVWKQTPSCSKVYTPMIADQKTRGQRIDTVSGRMCLLSASKKYDVTVGEICRRISAPETLHTSLINGILRNGKAKDNGTKLRANLLIFNVQLPQGRRKTCNPTGFTALCEAESMELATDLRTLLLRDGGVTDIGVFFREEDLAGEFMMETAVVRKWLLKIIEFHPENAECDDIVPKNGPEHCVHHLSLLTHGFSHIAIPVILRFALSILDNVNSPKDEERLPMPQQPKEETPPTPQNPENAMNMFRSMPPDTSSSAQLPFTDMTNQASFPGGFYPYSFPMIQPWAQQQMMQQGFGGGHFIPQFAQTTPQATPSHADKTYVPLLKSLKDRISKFDEVSGRLLLLSQSHKYVVTTGEVCRRMAAPETLHTSVINGILRNAKARDNGTLLRSKLQNYNIELPQGRRKTCQLTKFTALCEAEARSLAKDFEQLLDEEHAGAEEIGTYIGEMEAAEGSRSDTLVTDVPIVKKWLLRMIQVHMKGAEPDALQPTNSAERAVHHLSLITHGFSHVAIPAVFSYVRKIMDAALKANVNTKTATAAKPSMPLEVSPPMMPPMMAPMPFFPPANGI